MTLCISALLCNHSHQFPGLTHLSKPNSALSHQRIAHHYWLFQTLRNEHSTFYVFEFEYSCASYQDVI